MIQWYRFFGIVLAAALTGCGTPTSYKMANQIFYVEIPVENMDRAVAFYGAVFGFELEREIIDGNEMALFPFVAGSEGATGALAKGDSYRPSKDGPRVYFSTTDIDSTLNKATKSGAEILYPKTDVGEYGFVAEISDSEGNRIALHMRRR
jgi:predicted enzyme related to lactoylglutathione lyase